MKKALIDALNVDEESAHPTVNNECNVREM